MTKVIQRRYAHEKTMSGLIRSFVGDSDGLCCIIKECREQIVSRSPGIRCCLGLVIIPGFDQRLTTDWVLSLNAVARSKICPFSLWFEPLRVSTYGE